MTTANPLAPLTADEIAAAAAILKGAKGLGAMVRFISIELHEPAKRSVLDGVPVDREAFAVLRDRDSRTTIEAVVSITRGELLSWREVPGAQPGFSRDEFADCDAVLRSDPRFREALRRRGITDLDSIAIDLWAAGNTGPAEDPARRLMRPQVYVRQGMYDNRYAHPVEGLTALVDIDRMEVAELVDHGVVPIPNRHGNYIPELITGEIEGYPDNVPAFAATRDDLRPLEITQPDGPSFTLNGYELSWQRWRLRVGYTMREGLVLHRIGYDDGGRERPIVYRASMSELYVPYGDPNPSQRV
ncbi:tyramine oxidase, partial [Amycolatopsis sp. NPDC059235]